MLRGSRTSLFFDSASDLIDGIGRTIVSFDRLGVNIGPISSERLGVSDRLSEGSDLEGSDLLSGSDEGRSASDRLSDAEEDLSESERRSDEEDDLLVSACRSSELRGLLSLAVLPPELSSRFVPLA